MKLTIKGERKRNIDVRVKFKQGKPKVLLAKKNEENIVVFDVVHLHRLAIYNYMCFERETVCKIYNLHVYRNHDIRMAMSCYEVVKPGSAEHTVMERLLKTMSLTELDNETITLVTKTDDWCVNFIRHKKRETYCYKDKYLVTITDAAEYQLRKEHQRSEPVTIFPDNYSMCRTECEVMDNCHKAVCLN